MFSYTSKIVLFFVLIFCSYFCFADYYKSIVDSIKRGDSHSIKMHINLHSIPIQSVNPQKQSLFHLAVLYNQQTSLETLIYLAKSYKYLDLIIDRKDKNGKTALMLSLETPENPLTRILLENGANPNLQSPSNQSAFFIALKNNDLKGLDLLLKHQLQIDFKSVSKEHLNIIASSSPEALKKLIKNGLNVNLTDHTNKSLLHEASALGLSSQVFVLLKNGANPKKLDSYFRSPLYLAIVIANDLKTVKLLIDHKADIRKITDPFKSKESLIHIIAANGQQSILEYLPGLKSLVNLKDKFGRTPLMMAIKNNHKSTAQKLIEKGANLDLQDYKGETALHYAMKKNLDLGVLLLKHGANPFIKDHKGDIFIEAISEKNNKNVKEKLAFFKNFLEQAKSENKKSPTIRAKGKPKLNNTRVK